MNQGRLTGDLETQRILVAMFSKSFGSLLGFALGKLYLFVSKKLKKKKRRGGLKKPLGQKIAVRETIF